MVAPIDGEATCSLWFMAMDPGGDVRLGRKISYPVQQLVAEPEPFRLQIADSELSDRGMAGGFEDVRWELSWEPGRPYEHVHPLLRRGEDRQDRPGAAARRRHGRRARSRSAIAS